MVGEAVPFSSKILPYRKHYDIVDYLDRFAQTLRRDEQINSFLEPGGICHGKALYKIIYWLKYGKDFERVLSEFENAPLIQQITPGTPAWKQGYILFNTLPAAFDLSLPFVDKYFAKQPQTGSYAHLALQQSGKYTLTFYNELNKHATLEFFLEEVKKQNKSIAILIMFEGHTISLIYDQATFNIWNTNEPSKNFTTIESAANYIYKEYMKLKGLKEDIGRIPCNVTIEILKDIHDQSPESESLLEYLRTYSYYSRSLKDHTTSALLHNLRLNVFRNILDVPRKNLITELENCSFLQELLQELPLEVLKSVLDTPEFVKQINISNTYNLTRFDNIIKHFDDTAEKRLAASILYILLRKHNVALEVIVVKEYNLYGNPLLLHSLNADQLLNLLIGSKLPLQTKKIITETYSKYILENNINIALQNFHIKLLPLIINILFFQNKLDIAIHILNSYFPNQQFIDLLQQIRNEIIEFSIQEKKHNWFDEFFILYKDPPEYELFYFIKQSLKYENEYSSFILLKAIRKSLQSNKITLLNLLNEELLFYAGRNCGYEFFSKFIEQARSVGLLYYLIPTLLETYENILHDIIYQGKTKHVELLIKEGVATNQVSGRYETPLFLACVMGNIKIAEMIFTANINHLIYMPNPACPLTIFDAAKNSLNPDMYHHLISLYLQRYSLVGVINVLPKDIVHEHFLNDERIKIYLRSFPLKIICSKLPYVIVNNYFIEYLKENNPQLCGDALFYLLVNEKNHSKENISQKNPITSLPLARPTLQFTNEVSGKKRKISETNCGHSVNEAPTPSMQEDTLTLG